MTDLPVTAAYFLFAVEEKGKIFGYDSAKAACMISAALYELSMEGSITLLENKVRMNQYPPESEYLVPVYKHLGDMDLLTYQSIFQDYSSSISEWNLNALTTGVGSVLADKHLVTKAKVGFFGGRTFFVPHAKSVPAVAAEYVVDLQYTTPPKTADCFLWYLLENSRCIPTFIDKEQISDLHTRVEQAIQTNDELAQLIRFTKLMLASVKKSKLQTDYY